MKLTIELVPRTCHFKNVRSEVSQSEWDRLRKQTYRNANYVCEICGGVGDNHPVECHEIWDYDDKALTQTLTGLVALCPRCHEVKHMGLAQIKGNGDRALMQFAIVNDISIPKAQKFVGEAFETYHKRSDHKWKLDITWLDKQRKDNEQQE